MLPPPLPKAQGGGVIAWTPPPALFQPFHGCFHRKRCGRKLYKEEKRSAPPGQEGWHFSCQRQTIMDRVERWISRCVLRGGRALTAGVPWWVGRGSPRTRRSSRPIGRRRVQPQQHRKERRGFLVSETVPFIG